MNTNFIRVEGEDDLYCNILDRLEGRELRNGEVKEEEIWNKDTWDNQFDSPICEYLHVFQGWVLPEDTFPLKESLITAHL